MYAALTWAQARPPHSPQEAAEAVRLLVEEPSAIRILNTGVEAGFKMLELVVAHQLTARRTHDARHAARAYTSSVIRFMNIGHIVRIGLVAGILCCMGRLITVPAERMQDMWIWARVVFFL